MSNATDDIWHAIEILHARAVLSEPGAMESLDNPDYVQRMKDEVIAALLIAHPECRTQDGLREIERLADHGYALLLHVRDQMRAERTNS